MKTLTSSSRATWFLAVATISWLALVHLLVFSVFDVSLNAVWLISGCLTATFGAIFSYLTWEFRRAIPLPDHESEAPVQDVSLLMLSRSTHGPRPSHLRRTRTRLSGSHPATDRIVALHRPPHLDRRMRKPAEPPLVGIAPLQDYSKNESGINPSAN